MNPSRSTTLARLAATLVGLTLIVAASACSSGHRSDAGGTSPTTAAAPAGSTSPTSSAGASTTTAPPPKPPATPITIASSTDGTSPDGSGCSPSATATLPDGTWFALLQSIDTTKGTIDIDLACWFTGDAANAASTADNPGNEVPVPNDYYVRNNATTVRTLRVVPDVAVVPLAELPGGPTGVNGPTQTGLAAAATIRTDDPNGKVWVRVTDGWVTVIQAQFTP